MLIYFINLRVFHKLILALAEATYVWRLLPPWVDSRASHSAPTRSSGRIENSVLAALLKAYRELRTCPGLLFPSR